MKQLSHCNSNVNSLVTRRTRERQRQKFSFR